MTRFAFGRKSGWRFLFAVEMAPNEFDAVSPDKAIIPNPDETRFSISRRENECDVFQFIGFSRGK
jgi:hypothetical protein